MDNKKMAVLFDMDGVLVDSEVLMRKVGRLALADWGIEAKDEDFLPYTGRGEDLFIGGVAEQYGVPYDLAMKRRAYQYYGELAATDIAVPDGMVEVLTTLKERGRKIAVCTSADREKALYNLRALGVDESFFDAVITGDDIKETKPNPEIYLLGSSRVGISPEKCLVVEDAPSGIKAAHAGNMIAVGITSSFSEETLMTEAGPDIIIHDMRDLTKLEELM